MVVADTNWAVSHRRQQNLDTFRMMTELWPEPKPVAVPKQRERHWSETLEELEWLIGNGAMPWEAANVLGRSQDSLSRLAYRHGNKTLGTLMLPERNWKEQAA